MAWTDKMVEDLRIMWKQGLTTGEIGKRLGVSKNSIVGKVHRLQLDARPSPIKKKDGEKGSTTPAAEKKTKLKTEKKITATIEHATQQVKATKTQSTPSVQSAKKEIPEVKTTKETRERESFVPERIFIPKSSQPTKNYNGNAKLTDLDNHTCRWPLGDPKDDNFHFCGRKVKVGQTYCEEHAALAYVKPNSKK